MVSVNSSPRRNRRFVAAALAAVAIAVPAACSSPAGDGDRATTTTAAPASTEPADTSAPTESPGSTSPLTVAPTSPADTGGTPSPTAPTPTDVAGPATGEPVRIAAMYPDLTVLASLGFAEDAGDLAGIWEVFADDANQRGGIAGRPIELVPVSFDLLVEGDAYRACLTATQDLNAFIVLGMAGMYGDPVVCVAEQNETLLIGTDGFPAEFYERAAGRLFSMTPSKETTQLAIAQAFADELAAAPFAVLSSLDTGGDNDAVQATLLPALRAAGLEPAMTIVLDSDSEVAAGQIPLEVRALRDAGVATIVSTTNFVASAAFAQALDAAGVDLTWVGSDAAGFASNLFASQIAPAQLDGALATTFTTLGWEEGGLPELPYATECRQRAADLLGRDVPTQGVDTFSALVVCSLTDLLVAAGQAVDGELTTESMSSALQSVTDFPLATWGPAGFAAGRFEAARAARTVTWSADCECWSARGDFEPLG
ncbi:MAG TPA: ABC transporter substrate-binding protein [Ilumatobacter sp.]|nr:ABC transporter substrate-binding protein [Ilumatobacter sp.]